MATLWKRPCYRLSRHWNKTAYCEAVSCFFATWVLRVGGGPVCVIRWVSECECLEERGNERRKTEVETQRECVICYINICACVCVCMYWCDIFSSVSELLFPGLCYFASHLAGRCVCTPLCFYPASLLPPLAVASAVFLPAWQTIRLDAPSKLYWLLLPSHSDPICQYWLCWNAIWVSTAEEQTI